MRLESHTELEFRKFSFSIRTISWPWCGLSAIVVSMRYGRCRLGGKFRELFRRLRGYTANYHSERLACVIRNATRCARAAVSCGAVMTVHVKMKTLHGDCCSRRDLRRGGKQ